MSDCENQEINLSLFYTKLRMCFRNDMVKMHLETFYPSGVPMLHFVINNHYHVAIECESFIKQGFDGSWNYVIAEFNSLGVR